MKREIEIKYLLKSQAARDTLIEKLGERYSSLTRTGTKRIISYFYERGVAKAQILEAVTDLLDEPQLKELTAVIDNSSELMVKCRSINDANYFAVKGTPAGQDPVHAVNRLEFEVQLDTELETIDQRLQAAGIIIVSKWSSVRDYYKLDDNAMKAEIEFVAGYGYKAELEIVIDDGESSDEAIASLTELADSLGLVEANGTLLGKMYAHYNAHWQEYFNTRNTFSDETWVELGRRA